MNVRDPQIYGRWPWIHRTAPYIYQMIDGLLTWMLPPNPKAKNNKTDIDIRNHDQIDIRSYSKIHQAKLDRNWTKIETENTLSIVSYEKLRLMLRELEQENDKLKSSIIESEACVQHCRQFMSRNCFLIRFKIKLTLRLKLIFDKSMAKTQARIMAKTQVIIIFGISWMKSKNKWIENLIVKIEAA